MQTYNTSVPDIVCEEHREFFSELLDEEASGKQIMSVERWEYLAAITKQPPM